MFERGAKVGQSQTTVLGAGASIEGMIRASGLLRIDGRSDGVVVVDGCLEIGREGELVGDAVAHALVVRGRIEGSVNVRDLLHVAAGGAIAGEICYGSLQVDPGGMIVGGAKHGEQVLTLEVEGSEDTAALSEALGA